MRVCEHCGGGGYQVAPTHGRFDAKRICPDCRGTGLILLGPEGSDHYARLLADARARAVREGWYEEVWVEGPIRLRCALRQGHGGAHLWIPSDEALLLGECPATDHAPRITRWRVVTEEGASSHAA